MNCIVGQNGIGKSNLLDAILYGMGVRKDNVIRTSKNTALISGFGVGDIKSAEIKLTFEQGG